MAHLSDTEPFEGFLRATSRTGSLELAWAPFDAAELHAWILLKDPETLTPDDLHPERLLAELIRLPVAPDLGRATAYVPVGRPLGVMLVARDAQGAPCPTPRLELRSGAPVTRTAQPPPSPPAPSLPPAAIPPQPGPEPRIDPRAYARTPLVFAEHRRPPDFDALSRRVAERGAPPLRPPAPPLAPPPDAPSPAPPPSPAAPSPSVASTSPGFGFGARQRWTLTRLAFPAAPAGTERRLVTRSTFIGPAEATAWSASPPPDALPLPPQCDGVVDGLAPDDAMVFYLVLEARDQAWHPVPIAPVAPPFDEVHTPLLLGDPHARLAPLAARPDPTEAFATLVAQALASLARGVPVAPPTAAPPESPP